ncbi:IMP cyclohydrolase [Candidatus Pacearchaeota archaeon]|nr:IMP cyclohydrolase [Candidatus Pacearchaeota archaeon]
MTRGTDVTDMKRIYRTDVDGDFQDQLNLQLTKENELRYGENPNQSAAMYRLGGTNLAELTDIRLPKSGKGGLSATNFMDVTRALEFLKFFESPAVAVMKHLVPSGFSRQYQGNSLDNIYERARDTDARSAFGSIVVLNRPVDKVTAEAIMSSYVEGVAAPEFEEGSMGILERKKDIRAILYSNLDRLPRFKGDDIKGLYDIKGLPTGRVLVQEPYLSSIKGPEDLILDPLVKKEGKDFVVARDPTPQELEDLLTAWYVNLGVRSNGIVFVKDGTTLAVGTGQQERVGAIEQAIIKSYQKAMDREGIEYDPMAGIFNLDDQVAVSPLKGAVFSSDAFFPFRDSIDTVAKHGVTAVIQPGGSVKDGEIIQAVNEHDMAMAFTLERGFGHF